MDIRFLIFTSSWFFASLLGYTIDGYRGAFIAMLFAIHLWFFWDSQQGKKVLRWLIRTPKRKVPRVLGVWDDIVQQSAYRISQLHQRVKRRQTWMNNFLRIIQNLPNGVILLDDKNRIEWINQSACKHFGLRPDLDRLQVITNLLRDPQFVDYYQRQDYTKEINITGFDDQISHPIKLRLQIYLYTTKKGVEQKILVSRDVTKLEHSELVYKDFVANISHEIRTPLTIIVGFVETLQNKPVSQQDRQHFLTLIEQQAQHMEDLLQDLLTLSQLESKPILSTTLEEVYVNELLAQGKAKADRLSQALKQEHHITISYSPENHFIHGREKELLSAIHNLLSNAVRYTPGGGKIKVVWEKRPDQLGYQLYVEDKGIGIAPDQIPRITERFYRIQQKRNCDNRGTGLGLAIVKHVVQRHHATLEIQSKLGQGSRFSILFPNDLVGIPVTLIKSL